MRKQKVVTGWVIYKPQLSGGGPGTIAVCEQEEWDAMELFRPGYHTLIQAGITNEAEAERLARGVSGDARRSGYLRRR